MNVMYFLLLAVPCLLILRPFEAIIIAWMAE